MVISMLCFKVLCLQYFNMRMYPFMKGWVICTQMSKEFCPYIHLGCRSTSSVWCFYWNCHRKTSCALCRVTETFFVDCFVSNGVDPTLCYTTGTKMCEPYILVWPHALVHTLLYCFKSCIYYVKFKLCHKVAIFLYRMNNVYAC